MAKVLARGGVAPRRLCRLGAGAADLGGDGGGDSYGRAGRVDAAVARRAALLDAVARLAAAWAGGAGGAAARAADAGASCEAAAAFRRAVVAPAAARLAAAARGGAAAAAVAAACPCGAFLEALGGEAPLSAAVARGDAAAARAAALAAFDAVAAAFDELASYRFLELLRSRRQREDHVLASLARVVALTCTHAAAARRRLLALGFRYETVVFEEAAQITDAESLVPLALQRGDALRRVVLVGDDGQLPPVVSERALRSAGLDASLFSRLRRLGARAVVLDAQGRCRPEIADVFRWRYGGAAGLGDLPGVAHGGAFAFANPGFAHACQFVDVACGREAAPTPHFYQNLAEAEYVVAVYAYMRLLGYPRERVAVLAAYNGQRALLADALAARCGGDARLGMPGAVETVDKYQGREADYVLLSLTRTRTPGHLADPRRFVVATSRARPRGNHIFDPTSM